VAADDLLTTAQAAVLATTWRQIAAGGRHASVRPSAICNWASRGHLAPAGLDERGRPLYRPTDLARAELATRARALHRRSST